MQQNVGRKDHGDVSVERCVDTMQCYDIIAELCDVTMPHGIAEWNSEISWSSSGTAQPGIDAPGQYEDA